MPKPAPLTDEQLFTVIISSIKKRINKPESESCCFPFFPRQRHNNYEQTILKLLFNDDDSNKYSTLIELRYFLMAAYCYRPKERPKNIRYYCYSAFNLGWLHLEHVQSEKLGLNEILAGDPIESIRQGLLKAIDNSINIPKFSFEVTNEIAKKYNFSFEIAKTYCEVIETGLNPPSTNTATPSLK